jgi:hypothetical protein
LLPSVGAGFSRRGREAAFASFATFSKKQKSAVLEIDVKKSVESFFKLGKQWTHEHNAFD